jgi:hypothetical protein
MLGVRERWGSLTSWSRAPAVRYDQGDRVTGVLALAQVRRLLLFVGLVFAVLPGGSALADTAIGIGQTGTPAKLSDWRRGRSDRRDHACGGHSHELSDPVGHAAAAVPDV